MFLYLISTLSSTCSDLEFCFIFQHSRRSISLFWFPIFLWIRLAFHFNVQQPKSFKRSCQAASIAIVPILATRWRYVNWLLAWPLDGTTCINSRFSQQLALLELASWTSYKFGHQVVPLALLSMLASSWCHLHCHIAWDCPIDIISWYWVCNPHQPESHQLSLQMVLESVRDIRTHRSDPRDTWVR